MFVYGQCLENIRQLISCLALVVVVIFIVNMMMMLKMLMIYLAGNCNCS